MSLVSMKTLTRHALEHQYAVGYFESWNLESMLAVVDAAEQLKAPVIIGVNGSFVGNRERRVEENIYHYGSLGKALAENAKVPVALILNESDRVDLLVGGLKAGFNVIMYENPESTLEETVEINRYLAGTAHFCGAEVEAEIGDLPTADVATGTMTRGEKTDPDQAAWFVQQTGIDALAVAVGNVHLLEGKKSKLDLELIETLRKKIQIPLVLHGGTGVSEDDMKEAIRLGMCKINVGTVLKRTFINSIKSYFLSHEVDKIDPHDIIGRGGSQDMLMNARSLITEEVIRFMKIFGCENKAELR